MGGKAAVRGKENVFTPFHSPGSQERLHLRLSDADMRKIRRGRPWKATVTDLETGVVYRVRGATCGLPRCFCAAEVVPTKR